MSFQADSRAAQPDRYENWWLRVSGNLGGVYPFYDLDEPDHFSLDIAHIINRRKVRGDPVELDPAAVVCKTGMRYLLGDRTLIRNVRRAPWMARLHDNGTWEPVELPNHGMARPEPVEFVPRLIEALLKEADSYVGHLETVGILLSGGMDSRVTAGVLRQLQLTAGVPNRVVAITWGREDSRDVIYAGRIARLFNWEMIHFPLDANTLAENIEIAGLAGAEVAPFHLHAMPKVAQLKGIDAIIASSYGDSVGRAEFSGRKITNLKPILPKKIDPFGLLRHSALRDSLDLLKEDASLSIPFSGNAYTVRRHEVDQEMHYMRRMLQSCMLHIAKRIPLYQMFTAPEVFGLMWDLDPAVRDNSWYEHLLHQLPGDLLDIPWARTGRPYMQSSGKSDGLPKLNHAYGTWLREDLRELIVTSVNSDVIRGMGLFNDAALGNALKIWEKSTTKSTNSLDEFMSWLASLHVFISKHEITVKAAPKNLIQNCLAGINGRFYAEAYIRARNIARE